MDGEPAGASPGLGSAGEMRMTFPLDGHGQVTGIILGAEDSDESGRVYDQTGSPRSS